MMTRKFADRLENVFLYAMKFSWIGLFVIYFTILSGILCSGCSSTRARYTEGTMTQIGLYIPVESSIYGLQCLNYLNGCSVMAASNQTLTVEREFCSTNSYFGIISTTENSKTKATVK